MASTTTPTMNGPVPVTISIYGLTELTQGDAVREFDIVFVHGLQGHPESTWTFSEGTSNQTPAKPPSKGSFFRRSVKATATEPAADLPGAPPPSGTFWPRDFLLEDFPKARVFTYGYDSSVSHFFAGPANSDNILDRGRDLLERLVTQREKVRGRPIIFIAHSLGGLVVKSALRLSALAEDGAKDHEDILASTAGILFFGTPHRGSLWVSTGKIISRFAKAMGFSTSNVDLDLLRPNDAMLQILRDDFRRRLDNQKLLHVTSFQESKGYKGFNGFDEKIVDPDSSEIGHARERRLPVNANHMDMCKYSRTGPTWVNYEQVVKPQISRHMNRVYEALRESTAIVQRKVHAFDFQHAG